MSDKDDDEQIVTDQTRAYARIYPSIADRLRAAYRSGHPLAVQAYEAIRTARARAGAARQDRLRELGLTRAEVRVALYLIEGGAVADCARALSVSEGTVRTQLKSIFAKTGIRRQADLPRLIGGRR